MVAFLCGAGGQEDLAWLWPLLAETFLFLKQSCLICDWGSCQC